MRRILAISTVIALLLAVLASVAWAAPGGEKGKPDKTTTTATLPPVGDCVFDDGVLEGWHGQQFGYRCRLLADTPADFVFQIELGTADLIWRPYLAVTSNFLGGGICYRESLKGRVSESPITFEPFELPGDCGDSVDEFRLTVQGTARGGATLLRMLVPPPATP